MARKSARNDGTGFAKYGGFGGFAPNPSIPYQGGRVLTSDVNQASDAMNFGDYTPRSASTNVAWNPVQTDPSGSGFVNSRLFEGGVFGSASPSRQSQIWNSDEDTSRADTISSRGGRSPSLISDPNDDWMGADSPMGEPTADIARGDTSRGGGMNDEPVLFEEQPQGPQAETEWTTSSETSAAGSRGYAGRDIANFGGNMTLGQLLNTPLTMMQFGRGYPQNSGGNAVASGHIDLSQAGRDAYRARGNTYSSEASAGGFAEMSPEEQKYYSDRGETPPPTAISPDETIPTGDAVSPEVRMAQPANNPASQFGNLNSPTGQRVYFDGRVWRPVSGAPQDVRWNPLSGTGNYLASQTANALIGQEEWKPNDTGGVSDEGRTRFAPEFGTGHIDPETGFIVRNPGSRPLTPSKGANRGTRSA